MKIEKKSWSFCLVWDGQSTWYLKTMIDRRPRDDRPLVSSHDWTCFRSIFGSQTKILHVVLHTQFTRSQVCISPQNENRADVHFFFDKSFEISNAYRFSFKKSVGSTVWLFNPRACTLCTSSCLQPSLSRLSRN